MAGDNKRNFLTIVSHEIDKINHSYKRLNYQKLIPCNCEKCKNSKNPHFYIFEILRKFLNHRQEKIQCQESFKMVNVLGLIDDVIIWNEQDRDDNLHKYPHQQATTIINNYDKSNNIMSNITQSHSGSGDNVGGDKNTTNIYNSQDLTQAAADIQALLEQLEKTYPTNTTMGKMAIATEAIKHIDNDPQLAPRILSALKAGGTSALDSLLDHPAASFVIGALADWQQTKGS